MPLETDFSIVADSTMASSPRLEPMERDDDAPLQIKRTARTYGRRPEVPPAEASQISLPSYTSSLDSSTHKTAPPGLLEVVPPTSPTLPNTACSDSDGEDDNTVPKFNFGWKERMRMIDDDEDAEDSKGSPAPVDHVVAAPADFGRPFLLQQTSSGPKSDSYTGTTTAAPLITNDIFRDASLSQGEQSSSQVAPSQDTFILSSPKVAPPTRKRLSKVVHDSDSEPEPSKASSSATPSSSQPIHAINTPKSRSLSTTPPTSDDEAPMRLSGKSAGKRKSVVNSRPSVPPLDLIEGPPSESRTRTTSKVHKPKTKALSKKEQSEMLKEQVRLTVGANASSVIARGTISKYTRESFFGRLNKPEIASDPIEPYSSPPKHQTSNTASVFAATRIAAPQGKMLEIHDSDSDELPEISDILKPVQAKNKKEELRKMKQRALQQMQAKSSPHVRDEDDDDDLEIASENPKVNVKEEETRRSAQKDHISRTRQHQLQLAQVNPAKHKSNNISLLARGSDGSPIKLQESDRLDHASLSRVLAAQALKEARALAQKKAAEWEKYGGHVATVPEAPAEGLATTVRAIAEQGLKAAEASAANRMDVDDGGDDEDADDGDWDPAMRGSASPEPNENEGSGSEEENDENAPIDQDVEMAPADDLEDDDAGDSKVRSTRRMVIASDSEGENDENDENAPPSLPPAQLERYRRATSSADSIAEDEYDKENNNDLMYDQSEDKENTAVVRHALADRSSRSIFDIAAPLSPDRSFELQSQNDGKARRPFQELLSDKSPLSRQGSSSLTQSFAEQLLQASPQRSALAPAPTLKSFLGGSPSKSFSEFSQFSQDGEVNPFGAAPLLQPGFSDLFESTQKVGSHKKTLSGSGGGEPLSRDDIFSESTPGRKLQRTDTLRLTQDVSAALNLQPAFQVKEDLLRKADSIFEKEQAFVVESALQKPNRKPELYVNDNGFLTQTKPKDGTPEVYRPSPSQPAYAARNFGDSLGSPSGFRSRAPLRTLSFTSTLEPESPERLPLRRLKKAASPTPSATGISYSPSTTPPARQDAFALLARGAAREQRRTEARAARGGLDIAEFLEDEAAESDDDDHAFGFVKARTGDEEEGEDLDGTLAELMDDKEMDASTVAADLVLEKFQEQEQEMDKKVQELHEAAVAGLLRKRTRGVGVDDSDEESDDEGNERARRAMKKLRTTDRGDIQALAANAATEAFAAVYNQSLKDDDDFAYMAVESNIDDLVVEHNDAEGDVDADEYEDDEEEEEPETISPQEIMRIARRMKEDGVEEAPMDPEDVSWLDNDAEDDAPHVKTVSVRQAVRISQHDIDSMDMDGGIGRPFREPMGLTTSSKQWYAQENKTRNAGTSRSVGGSAITGHAKVKSKTGLGTNRTETQRTKGGSGSASAGPSRSVKPERSLLSAIADKSRHFG